MITHTPFVIEKPATLKSIRIAGGFIILGCYSALISFFNSPTALMTVSKVGGDAKTMGSLHHALYGILVSVHFLMAWNRALEFTKIALYLEYAIQGKSLI